MCRQLCPAGALEVIAVVKGFFNAAAAGQQAVIAQDQRVEIAEIGNDALLLVEIQRG